VDSSSPPIPIPANRTELLVSLRHLLRGLTALFWGLPLALLVCVQTAATGWLRALGPVPSVIATGLLLFGVLEITRFRRGESVWQRTLDRAKIFALLNFGLSPFAYFCNRFPSEIYYRQMVWIMAFAGVLFVFNLNRALKYLAAMLPDQVLREDTELFTTLNLGLMMSLVMLVAGYFTLQEIDQLPVLVITILEAIDEHRRWLVIFFVVMPVAMTMSLLWKIKEIVLTGIFGSAA
jgi:hypothetical protein